MAISKLSQIANGSAINAATDVVVAVRNGTTDVLVSLASLLPYTGATADVNLGAHDFATSGNMNISDTLFVAAGDHVAVNGNFTQYGGSYPDGLFTIEDTVGYVGVGDWNSDYNGTSIEISDQEERSINFNANTAFNFSGGGDINFLFYGVVIDGAANIYMTSTGVAIIDNDNSIIRSPSGATLIDSNDYVYIPSRLYDGVASQGSSAAILTSTGTATAWVDRSTFFGTAIQSAINTSNAQTTLSGTTAGTIQYALIFNGSSYKQTVMSVNGYENNTAVNQTITFGVPFTKTPVITGNNSGLTLSATTTTLTITAPNNTTVFNGTIIVEGL